jgi:hypothetical protein
MRFPQAHPGPTSIFINEFDAGSFQSAANCQVIGGGHRGLSFGELGPSNGGDADSGFAGEIFGSPSKQGPSGPNLSTR